jgi:integrase
MDEKKTRSRVKLNDTMVGKLKVTGKVYRVWDNAVPGFLIRVSAAGAKSYAVSFQRPNGKKVNITLGEAGIGPGKMHCDEARDRAGELRKLHRDGYDARAIVQDLRNASDMADLVKKWEEDEAHNLKETTRKSYESIIRTTILPNLGNRLVKDLVYEDISDLYKAIKKDTPTQANRAMAVLSKLFAMAEVMGWREDGTNPCRKLKRTRETPRERILQGWELEALHKALNRLVAESRLAVHIALMFKLIAFTGLRRSEALGLKISHLDFERNFMTFTHHKGDKRGTKVLPMSTQAAAILKSMKDGKLSTYAFPGTSLDRPFNGVGKVWGRILEVSGLEGITPHDLRRTFMTVCTELGHPPAVGDALLGHSLGKIRDVYIQLGSDGILATAAQDTANWIEAAFMGKNPKPGVKIEAATPKVAAGTKKKGGVGVKKRPA